MLHHHRHSAIRATALILLLLSGMAVTLPAVTIEGEFRSGNRYFGRARSSTDATLPAESYRYSGSLSFAADLTDQVSFTFGIERDEILRNYAYLRFAHTGPVATIAVGPVLGAVNDLNRWYYVTPGVFSFLRAELGTLGYVSFSSISSGFLSLDSVGDSNQSSYRAELGFYGAGIITSIYLDNRDYSTLTSSGRVEDSATEYGLHVDAFRKNVGYRIGLDFAYSSVQKRFVESSGTTTHTLGSLLFTPTLDLELGSIFTLTLGAENGLYTFGLNYLLGEFDPSRYFFNGFASLRLEL
mgnify:FL=1